MGLKKCAVTFYCKLEPVSDRRGEMGGDLWRDTRRENDVRKLSENRKRQNI